MVDRLRAGPSRRRLPDRGAGLQSACDRQRDERDRGADGDRAGSPRGGLELARPAREPVGPAAPAPPDELLRDRPSRNRGLRKGSRFRRHACRDHVRAPAQRHSCSQPASAFGAGRSGRDRILRRQAGGGDRTRRLRGFAHPFHRRRLARAAHRLRAWRWRKLDDEGKLWTFDPAASFTLETTLAPWRRRTNSSSAAPTMPLGERTDRAAPRPAAAARAELAAAPSTNPRRRALAGCRRDGRSLSRRTACGSALPTARRARGRM